MDEYHIYTYHCICNETILATFQPLEQFPKRKGDGARICNDARIAFAKVPIPKCEILPGSLVNSEVPVVLKLEDGFEKRYFALCRRCDLKVGYRLDESHFGQEGEGVRREVLYVLPGALVETDDLRKVVDGGGNGGAGGG